MASGHRSYDVVIVGGGPAGSTLACYLAECNRSVLIVEKADFPREHIGESLTGECGKIICELGLAAAMEQQGFPIKRGVTVFGPMGKTKFFIPVQDINSQGKLESRTTWQVRRSAFDKMLLATASSRGASYVKAEARNVLKSNGQIIGVELRHSDGSLENVFCRVVTDASGQSTFLSKLGIAGPRSVSKFDKQVAFYGRLTNVARDAVPDDGNTLIFYSRRHQWAWMIPISETETSIGVVLPASVFKESEKKPEPFFKDQLKTLHPDLAGRLEHATLESEVWRMSNYSYSIDKFAGPGFLCIGDAHRFLDPIFSFGVYIGMKEATLAAHAIDACLDAKSPSQCDPFFAFRQTSIAAHQIVQDIIDTFWEYPLVFLRLAHFTHRDEMADLFAGRIYSEAADQLEVVRLMRSLLDPSNKKKMCPDFANERNRS